jgi:hypothetical protein
MTPIRVPAGVTTLLAVAAFLAAAPTVTAGPVLPAFSASDFSPNAPIDNRYFPLAPGTVYRSGGTVVDPDTGETAREVDEDVVTRQTQTIAGVVARVVHARTWHDGILVEDTNDFYAQDKAGNVWYLAEDTTAFEYDDKGNIVGRDKTGSWRTGVHGAKPGFIMPADPKVGLSYYQEFSQADQAIDQAQVVSLTESITVPVGSFTNVQKSMETTAVEPGVKEFKYYAPGLGLILTEEDVDASGKPLDSLALESVTTAATVPLPPALRAGLLTLAIFIAGRWVKASVPKRRGGT